jgi:hypothetical protein
MAVPNIFTSGLIISSSQVNANSAYIWTHLV